MATTWTEADIRCPFFMEARGRQIRCEGILEDTVNTVTFRGSSEREEKMEKVCLGNYCKCGIYRGVEAKYES